MSGWLPAQRHAGEDIGETEVIFVELKNGQPRAGAPGPLGPQ